MKNILIEQNPHWKGKRYTSIKREALDKLISYLPLKQIITITGLRRCGKSTLAKQAIQYLIDQGTNPKNIFFINLEHPYFLEYRENPNYLNTIYEEYIKLLEPIGKVYFFLDEIQYFQNWQLFIKSKYETDDIKFIITGSNSSMLSHELITILSGRSLNIHLNTFSFLEYLDYKNIPYKDEFSQISNRLKIQKAKDDYLKWGGFYEVFEIDDENIKKDLLINYAKNIIYQDIVPRYNIRNSQIVERLFFYLLDNTTTILNYTNLSKIFSISDKTIKEYINYFEESFLFKRIDRFHNKQKEQIKSTKKIYTFDNGFLQIAPSFSKNLGQSLENAVFCELNTRNKAITYLKDNYEIDFKTSDTLLQVSYDINNQKTKNRELRAFKHFDEKNIYSHKLITHNDNQLLQEVEIKSFENFIFERA